MTSVGATQDFNPETSAPFSFSGFSNYFDTPSYQTAATEAYLGKLNSTYAGLFNTSCRGFPDVPAAGTNFAIIWGELPVTVNGTRSPERRLAAERSPHLGRPARARLPEPFIILN